MLRKVITQVLFGTPYPWLREYLAQCEALGPYGWEWKFFVDPLYTPWARSTPHVEIVPMSLVQFDGLVAVKLGVAVSNRLVGPHDSPALTGQPSLGDLWPRKVMSCYYPFHGRIFADWCKGYDFWGHTNWDMVFGRLDHFFTDELLLSCDIFSDEPQVINGIWSLYRNVERVNALCLEIPDWQTKLAYPGPDNKYTMDEHEMSLVVVRAASEGRIRFRYSNPYWHSHDTYHEHRYGPQLARSVDGGLWDLATRREIPAFHFKLSKSWPANV